MCYPNDKNAEKYRDQLLFDPKLLNVNNNFYFTKLLMCLYSARKGH